MPNQQSDAIDWRGWTFTWSVLENEGLSLLDGSYRGIRIFHKLSLPVIRVKYLVDKQVDWEKVGATGGAGAAGAVAAGAVGIPALGGAALGAALGVDIFGGDDYEIGAGPFADHISWNPSNATVNDARAYGLIKTTWTDGEYVGVKEFMQSGVWWLLLRVYARIGAYHIVQDWHVSELGKIVARVGSRGLHTNMDHTHHPYWRLDFDVDGASENSVYRHIRPDTWHRYELEAEDRANVHPSTPLWVVRNERTGRQVWIERGEENAHADGFSHFDIAVRAFTASEQIQPYPPGTDDKGELQGNNGEPVSNTDVVLWYVAHMFHRGEDGGNSFHWGSFSIQVDLEVLDSHSGFAIQSTFGGKRANFELAVPQERRLVHHWRNVDDAPLSWHAGEVIYDPRPAFLGGSGSVSDTSFGTYVSFGRSPVGVSILQADRRWDDPGPLVAIARTRSAQGGSGDELAYFYRFGTSGWKGPADIVADGTRITGVTGNPAVIQSTFGARRANFELLVPQGRELVHYWRQNDDDPVAWHKGEVVYDSSPSFLLGGSPGEAVGKIGAFLPVPIGVALIQAHRRWGDPGPLVAVVRVRGGTQRALGDRLQFFYRFGTSGWKGPADLIADGQPIAGVTGDPALIQSTWGARRANFELLVPQGAQLVHYWRNNDDDRLPWHKGEVVYDAQPQFLVGGGASKGPLITFGPFPVAVSLFQAHRGWDDPGPLVAVVRMRDGAAQTPTGDRLQWFYRFGASGWKGPFDMLWSPITNVTGDA